MIDHDAATRSGDASGGVSYDPDPGANVREDPIYVVKAHMFRVLGHPIRIRILELLRDRGELTVRVIQSEVKLDSGGTSHHLTALRQAGFLDARRTGTSVHYRIADARITLLLAIAKDMLTSALGDSVALLHDLEQTRAPEQ